METEEEEMVLKLEGTMTVADAKMLEEICEDLRENPGLPIKIDMSAVNFLGNRSAQVLCRLRAMPDVIMQGMHLFVQQIMDSTEATKAIAAKDGESNE
jgi:anti-anti-sigma regulatory factor